MGFIRKTVSVYTSLGLVGYRSKPEQEARRIRLAAEAAQRQTAGLLQRQNELIKEQTAAIRGQDLPAVSGPAARHVPPAPRSANADKRDLERFRREQTAAANAQLEERERVRKLREAEAEGSLHDHLLGPQ
jgi:hypothetical protein